MWGVVQLGPVLFELYYQTSSPANGRRRPPPLQLIQPGEYRRCEEGSTVWFLPPAMSRYWPRWITNSGLSLSWLKAIICAVVLRKSFSGQENIARTSYFMIMNIVHPHAGRGSARSVCTRCPMAAIMFATYCGREKTTMGVCALWRPLSFR